MNLRTVKWAQCDKTQSRELYEANYSSKCAYDCAQPQLYTIQHRTVLIIRIYLLTSRQTL